MIKFRIAASARVSMVGCLWGLALAAAGCLPDPARGTAPQPAPNDTGPTGPGPSTTAPPIVTTSSEPATAGRDGGVTVCAADGGAAVPRPPAVRGGGPTPTLPLTVTTSPTAVPPLSGGTLRALADGKTAVASDPDRDQIYVVDLAANQVRATLTLMAGDEPGRVVEDASGRVHVALRRGGALVTLDPKTGTLVARRAVCSAPRGVAYDKSGDLVHVACAGGELVSLPAAGGAATRTLQLDRDLRDVVVSPKGLLVSTFRRAEVLVVGADGKVGERLRPPSGMRAAIMGQPQRVSPAVAWRMEPAGDGSGGVLMLHQVGVDDLIDPAAGGYAGLKGCSGVVGTGVTSLAPQVDNAMNPPVGGLGMVSLGIDLAVSPDGQKVAIAVAGNSLTAGAPTVVLAPRTSIVDNSDSCHVPETPQSSGANVPMPPGQVVSVSFMSATVVLAQTREPATLWRSDTGVALPLAAGMREDTGHTLFHVNAGGGLACASCHPEGGEDGRVWNFACAGARRTQSIRGGISPTAPFHWDGSESDFSRLMDDVFVGRMAGPAIDASQKQALLSWIDTIPALPTAGGLDAAAVGRGQALFNDPKVACATCHAGSLLTNNATIDVGTGQALQVPSLRGVSWRAPFMHDGCAATFNDRFYAGSCGGGDKHGGTSQLSSTQVADLVTYLSSL
jgi:hypothetical protein